MFERIPAGCLPGPALIVLSLGFPTTAVAVVGGNPGVPSDAQALGQLRLSANILYPQEEETDDDRQLTAWPLESGGQENGDRYQSYGFTPSNYFMQRMPLSFGVVNTAGILYGDLDKIEGTVTAPDLNNSSFYTDAFNDTGSLNSILTFKYVPRTFSEIDLGAKDLFKYHFGFGADWKLTDSIRYVSLPELKVPDEQQTKHVTDALARQTSGYNSGYVFSNNLTQDYGRLQFGLGARYWDEDDQFTIGDGFQYVHRTDGGTQTDFKRELLNPANSVVRLHHDFSYDWRDSWTDTQLGTLSNFPLDDERIPDGTIQPHFRITRTGELALTESGYSAARDSYYETLDAIFGITEADIYKMFNSVKIHENAISMNFAGYEQPWWSMGAAQPSPRATRHAAPKSNPKRLPNDNYFHASGSWGQDYEDQWGLKQIGITDSGRDGKGSLWPREAASTIVAVVDTGIDFGHPELYGALWANFKDIPNNRKDDDGNGYVDDFIGWNFIDSNNSVRDDNGHGTFVSGIIAATTDNGFGISGINPWARILPIKVTSFDNVGSSTDIALGILYAARMGARVINVSIAGPLNKVTQVAADEAVKAGALVVVAAGNDGVDVKDVAPAGLRGVITVAATNPKGQREAYSNWGASIDIAAPGTDILSLRAVQTDLMLFADEKYQAGANVVGSDRLYYRTTGTSFSAPYVAGVASLLFSLNPKLTPEQVKRMILHSARDIDIPGIDQFTGYGLLDAAAALKANPEFFVDARIAGVKVVQKDGKPHVRVSGTADADKLKKAWIEIGKGDNPDKWKKVTRDVKQPVRGGPLGDIPAGELAGAKQWTLRVVTEHKNGRKRENRFVLKLG